MKRLIAALVFGSIVGVTVYAAAAAMVLASDDLGAGDDAVERCDTGLTLMFVVEDNKVTAVDLGQIDAACGGGALEVSLTNALGVVVGTGTATVPALGGSVSVPIASEPAAIDVKNQHIIIVGPL